MGNFTASEILRDAMLFWKSEGLPSSFSDALGLTYDRAVASSPELVAEIRAHMTGFPDTTNDFGYVMELMSHNHNENWFTDKSVNKFRYVKRSSHRQTDRMLCHTCLLQRRVGRSSIRD